MSTPDNIRKLSDASEAYMQAMDAQIKAHLAAAEALGEIREATSAVLAEQLDWADPTEGDYPFIGSAGTDIEVNSEAVSEPGVAETVSSAAPDLMAMEDVRQMLAEMSRSGMTDQIKDLIRAQGKTKLSQLSVEQANLVYQQAKELENGAQ